MTSQLCIDEICVSFEERWSSLLQTDFRPFLGQVDESEQSQLLRELLLTDRDMRQSHGLPASKDFYLQAYPEHGKVIEATFSGSNNSTPLSALNGDSVQFGEHELLEELGEGGMGIVYKARSLHSGRIVALKRVKAGKMATEMERQRFLREAEIASTFQHPSIVPVYHVGIEKRQPYFTMQIVEGSDLKEWLTRVTDSQRSSRQYQRQIASIAMKVAQAMAHAHDRGIIHRDLKPGNILLDMNEEPYVTDFGLAKQAETQSDLSQAGQIAMTVEYASPEQSRGEVGLTKHTDIYSLGVILYEALTGALPFSGSNILETIDQIQNELPPDPTSINTAVDHRLKAICLKCLEKEPRKRYVSAEELAEDLSNYLENRRSSTWPSTIKDFFRSVFQSRYDAGEFAGLYGMVILHAVLILPFYLAQYWLIQNKGSEILLWVTCFIHYPLGYWIFARHRAGQNRPHSVAALMSQNTWRAVWIGKLTILISGCLFLDEDFGEVILKTYPAVLTLLGMAYFIQARVFWPRYYLYALAYFVAAVLIPIRLDLAPLVLGALVLFGWLHMGLSLRRLHHSRQKAEQHKPTIESTVSGLTETVIKAQ